MICMMHFPSIKSPFVSFFCILLFSINGLSYFLFLFPLTCRCQNNEHKNESANGQGFYFERVVYAGKFGDDDDMKDNDLPLDLLRLVEQDERQILPY